MGIIKNYHDKKWTLQFLDYLYNSIDINYAFIFIIQTAYVLVHIYPHMRPYVAYALYKISLHAYLNPHLKS
jgi:hypothetical protein